MKRTLKSLPILAIPAALALSTGAVQAELDGKVTGNLTATSNYVWRGQEAAGAALQAGINYDDKTGIYAGAWTSNVDPSGNELDLYIGYAGTAGAIEYDVGFIMYQYPQNSDANAEEFYAGISQGAFAAKISTSSDMGDYIEVSAVLPVKRWEMMVHFGHYSVEVGDDYVDYSVTFTKPMQGYDMSFMISDTDLDDDAYRTVVSVSKDFQP